VATKQVKYLRSGDWVLGPEPKPGNPRLLALVKAVGMGSNGMCSVDVQIKDHEFTAQQNAENVVQVWDNSDLPHRVKRADEWPALWPSSSMGVLAASN